MISSQVVPQGYQKTKVGVIPEDWEVVKLKDIVKVSQGLQIPISKRFIEPSKDRVFYITIPYIEGKKIEYIENAKKNILCKKDDLLVVRTGSGVGKIITNVEGACHNNFFKIEGLRDLNIKFIFYFLTLPKTKHLMKTYASNGTIPDLPHGDFYSLDCKLPAIKEQEKIANILTTWDNAIAKQNALIEAKEELKKGLMQKLLSGEIRFDGFSDKWEDTKLKQLINDISIKNKDKKIDLVLTVSTKHGFISQKDYFEREIASNDTSNYKIVNRGNFAYNPSRINIGSISYLEEFEKGILSPMYVIFNCNDRLEDKYFDYWLNTHSFKGNLSKYLSGSVRDSLSFKDMSLMKLKLPSLQEQEKIAEVLTNADKEIDLLKNELEALKEQKKGLMQKLLTGEVRVKI